MSKSAGIDYKLYAERMRSDLSGPEICNPDKTINHAYFNTKKGFYWSNMHNEALVAGVFQCGTNWPKIRKNHFNGMKSEIEIEMRTCMLFNVKDSKFITDHDINDLKKKLNKKNSK